MKIAIVGGGIFGCVSALKLKREGFDVTVYEEKSSILRCASGVNQYRLHVGYHYPRSLETALSSSKAVNSFKNEFGACLSNAWHKHYYGLSAYDSRVNATEYIKFLLDTNLPFRILGERQDWIDISKLQLLIEVQEHSIDINLLKIKLYEQLMEEGVLLLLNNRFQPNMKDEYDVVVNATYSNINYLLEEKDRIEYQFELCEKPVVLLPKEWEYRSLVVIDGPFFCLDRHFAMGCHVMGHVEHAIHSSNIGFFPEIPPEFSEYSNSGLILHRPLTNFPRFRDAAKEYLPGLDIKTLGSMYTVRTVLPYRDSDDARPSHITRHSDRLYSIFSGKIGTCVDIADELVKKLL